MTFEVPRRTAEYVERRGSRYRAELNAIFVAIVETNMRSEETVAQTNCDGVRPGLAFVNALRGSAPLLDDDEMRVFERVKDFGRKVDFA